jgi:hypothetical protein
MSKPSYCNLTAAEQAVLDGVTVRLVEDGEVARFNARLVEEHYLHSADLVGEHLRYVAEYGDQWLALLTWSAAAYHLRDREAWIGWSEAQRRRRLNLVVNNSRYLIVTGGHYPNLASRVMKLNLARLEGDWEKAYGHPVLVAESFVDSQLFRGTSYKASGWQLLGQTQGWGRSRQDFYVAHERPKQLWVRELQADACRILRQATLPPACARVEALAQACCTETPAQLRSATEYFARIPDFRGREGFYSLAGVMALIASANLCGVQRGQRDLAAYGRTLSQAQLKALGFKKWSWHGDRRCYHAPGETTFFRILSRTDSRAVEAALLGWQELVLGPRPPGDNLVALDGKENRSSQGTKLVNAYAVKSGRWLGSEPVPTGTNEIPTAGTLVKRLELENQTTALDALHTQVERARQLVQEKGSHYLLVVKGNQGGLCATLQTLLDNLQKGFSPSPDCGRSDPERRTQSQPFGSPLPATL